jgi:hypothetical protein
MVTVAGSIAAARRLLVSSGSAVVLVASSAPRAVVAVRRSSVRLVVLGSSSGSGPSGRLGRPARARVPPDGSSGSVGVLLGGHLGASSARPRPGCPSSPPRRMPIPQNAAPTSTTSADRAPSVAQQRGAGSRPPGPSLVAHAHLSARPAPSRSRPAAADERTQAPQALDQHRVVGERRLVVDHAVEQLVVARRRDVEALADGLLLRAGVLPPLALEVEDLARSSRPGGVVGPSGPSWNGAMRGSPSGIVTRPRGTAVSRTNHTRATTPVAPCGRPGGPRSAHAGRPPCGLASTTRTGRYARGRGSGGVGTIAVVVHRAGDPRAAIAGARRWRAPSTPVGPVVVCYAAGVLARQRRARAPGERRRGHRRA